MVTTIEKNKYSIGILAVLLIAGLAIYKRVKSLFNRLSSSALSAYHLTSSEASKVVNLADVVNTEVGSYNADEDKLISMLNDLSSTNSVNALMAYYSEIYSRSIKDDLESVFNFMDWSKLKISYRNILEP